MRRLHIATTGLLGAALLVAAPVWAQEDGGGGAPPGELPAGFDEALAQELESELLELLGAATGAPVDPASLDDLIGEPGDLDLPPGELLATTLAVDAAAVAATDPGGGAELTGPCMGLALSFDGDGELVDAAGDLDPDAPPVDLLAYYESGRTDVETAFTSSNPFRVDVDGFVAYIGVAGAPGAGPRNHTWEITSFGAALDSGGDPNSEGENRNAGSVDLGEQLPAIAKVNALFRIEGSMDADDGFACDGSGYFETTGGAPVLEGAGLVLLALGGLGAVFNARPARTWRG